MKNNLLEEIRKVHPEAVIDRSIDDVMNEIKEKVIKMEPNFSNYDCPIQEQFGEIKTLMMNEHERQIIKVVQEIGIQVDREGLAEALNNDRRWYEEAYQKGWADCEEHYKDILSKIKKLIGGDVNE